MCGRYALSLRPSEVRHQLEQAHMPVDEAPDDDGGDGGDGLRQSYNFAPGYHGLVYRADGPEFGRAQPTRDRQREHQQDIEAEDVDDAAPAVPAGGNHGTKYKLQAMKWGLVPFWTKRNPDYGTVLKTINCRDDSLIEDRGMWTSMKKKKRCVVVAQGFYEWLKKPNSRDKMPHFTKRKDGQLMCFAGLWDCVRYEESDEKHYTYTIITTDSNKQLKFLHDRMPVILENGSEAIKTWLDPNRTEWSQDLQSLLKPFEGELECYPVSKDVGKVGNNSPAFIVPIDSAENKNNIANFFGNQRKAAKPKATEKAVGKTERDLEDSTTKGVKVEHDVNETRETTDRVEGSEDNAPLPVPSPDQDLKGVKRERSQADDERGDTAAGAPQQKRRISAIPGRAPSQSPKKNMVKSPPAKTGRKNRSATSNGNVAKGSPAKGDGMRKITSFFTK